MEEIWKDIPGYEGLYQVSNLGRVKSCKMTICKPNGGIRMGRIRTQSLDHNGYFGIVLSKFDIKKTIKVHQLVAMAFLGYVRNGYEMTVNHKNFIRTDNILDNLEVVTCRENSNKKHLKHSSIYTGVGWHKINKKWTSTIHFNKKQISLGYFSDELEASQYYEAAVESINNGTEIKLKRRINSSKYRGVSWNKNDKVWISQITFNKQKKQIGRFKDEYQAHLAYQNELKRNERNDRNE